MRKLVGVVAIAFLTLFAACEEADASGRYTGGNFDPDVIDADTYINDSGNVEKSEVAVEKNEVTVEKNEVVVKDNDVASENTTVVTDNANYNTVNVASENDNNNVVTKNEVVKNVVKNVKVGDVASGNTVVAPIANDNDNNTIVLPVLSGNAILNDVVDIGDVSVGINCSVLAHCEDNDTVIDDSFNQDNDSVDIDDRSTNINDSFNGNRDSFNASSFAIGQNSLISRSGIAEFVRVVERRPILTSSSTFDSRLEAGKFLPKTGFDAMRTALLGFSLIAAGLTLERLGRKNNGLVAA